MALVRDSSPERLARIRGYAVQLADGPGSPEMDLVAMIDKAMIPLVMTDNPPAIVRWCETCQRFTRSRMSDFDSAELCAEHEDYDEWDDD